VLAWKELSLIKREPLRGLSLDWTGSLEKIALIDRKGSSGER
jgi:hypothetical protein